MTMKKCDFCNKEFQAKRSDARFCSTTCKARAWDQKKEIPKTPSVQSNLRGVIGSAQHQSDTIQQPEMVALEEFNPQLRIYFQEISALNRQKMDIEASLKILQNSKLSVGVNYDGLTEMAAIGGGALLASTTWNNTAGIMLGGVAGELIYNLFKPTPEQKAIKIEQDLILISVQEYELNVRLTSIQDQITVLTRKFKATPQKLTRMVEKPVITVDPGTNNSVELPVFNRPQDVQTSVGDSNNNDAPSTISGKIKTSIEVHAMEFKALGFKGEWNDFLGSPSITFSAVIHGLPGQGKSTFSLLFALYLAENFGKVIYITAEEGFSKTMQDKLKLNKASHPDLHIADLKSMDEIKTEVNTNKYNFIFIDSLNVLHIDIEDLHELHKLYQGAAMITVSQSTKDGKIRGSQEIVHDCDIAIEVANGIARTTKNRFQATPRELTIFKRP